LGAGISGSGFGYRVLCQTYPLLYLVFFAIIRCFSLNGGRRRSLNGTCWWLWGRCSSLMASGARSAHRPNGHDRLRLQTYFFNEGTLFFSRNKSVNSIF
jgi:hypothetical protein